jgi:hypothetical protein
MKRVIAKGWDGLSGQSFLYVWDPSVCSAENLKVMFQPYLTATPVGEYNGHQFNADTQISEYDGIQPGGGFKLGWEITQPPSGGIVNPDPGWTASDLVSFSPGDQFILPSLDGPIRTITPGELEARYNVEEV